MKPAMRGRRAWTADEKEALRWLVMVIGLLLVMVSVAM